MADTHNSRPLVWIDCEGSLQRFLPRHNAVSLLTSVWHLQMTGLDVDNDVIIEIFCIITNGNLDVLDEEGWGVVIHQSKERMDEMDEWCTETHGQNGLTAAVIASTTTPEEAASSLLEYIQKYVPEPKRALLAGSSVHCDKAFLRKAPYKKVDDHLSYRILDVSTLKEAAKRWCPLEVIAGVPKKKNLHQAKEDILESIATARYFKETVFQARRARSGN